MRCWFVGKKYDLDILAWGRRKNPFLGLFLLLLLNIPHRHRSFGGRQQLRLNKSINSCIKYLSKGWTVLQQHAKSVKNYSYSLLMVIYPFNKFIYLIWMWTKWVDGSQAAMIQFCDTSTFHQIPNIYLKINNKDIQAENKTCISKPFCGQQEVSASS